MKLLQICVPIFSILMTIGIGSINCKPSGKEDGDSDKKLPTLIPKPYIGDIGWKPWLRRNNGRGNIDKVFPSPIQKTYIADIGWEPRKRTNNGLGNLGRTYSKKDFFDEEI